MRRARSSLSAAGRRASAAALAAKQQDAAAEVVLLSDEQHEPYEKPPLSKAVLTGKAMPHDAPIAGPKGVAGERRRAQARHARDGDRSRRARGDDRQRASASAMTRSCSPPARSTACCRCFRPGRNGIYYLRTEAEARALKAHLHRSRSLLVIGGGLIGLEVAASAAELGVKTSVIEIAPRILARVCDEETSALIHERHRARGVDIRIGTAASALRELPDGRLAVDTKDGGTIAADLIVVGAGAAPDDRLAKAAGLAMQDGIIVDDHGRTSDPAIFAAGDCTRFPGPHGPVRLENWRHAQEHGAIAGRNAAGGDVAYKSRPRSGRSSTICISKAWAGRSRSRARACAGRSATGATLLFELDGPRLAYASGINAQRDMAVARRLIERGCRSMPASSPMPRKPLAAMLKAKV